jgi:hypothetical protein
MAMFDAHPFPLQLLERVLEGSHSEHEHQGYQIGAWPRCPDLPCNRAAISSASQTTPVSELSDVLQGWRR